MSNGNGAGELIANVGLGTILLVAFCLTLLRIVLNRGKSGVARSLREVMESILLAGNLVFLIIRPFLFQAFFIPTESMEPTLHGHDQGLSKTMAFYPHTVHDHLFVNKLLYRFRAPRRGEIVVFRAPKKADYEGNYKNENILIKRLVAVPGDIVQVQNGTLFVNQKPQTENYIREPMNGYQRSDAAFATDTPYKLPPDNYFVMGDNRNHSWDSRFWGPVTGDRIIGKASFVFWPFSSIGLIN